MYYPVNVCMDMVSGRSPSAIGFLGVMAMTLILFGFSKSCVLKMWDRVVSETHPKNEKTLAAKL